MQHVTPTQIARARSALVITQCLPNGNPIELRDDAIGAMLDAAFTSHAASNEEINATVDAIANKVKASIEDGRSSDDIRDMVFINVKAAILAGGK